MFIDNETVIGRNTIQTEKETIHGTLLELKNKGEVFELTIVDSHQRVKFIHSKKIVLTSYSILAENEVISLYEVLWAAKVKLDPITLYPITDKNQETNIQRLYCDFKIPKTA